MLRFGYGARGVRVVFGDGALAHLADEMRQVGKERPLLVGTPGRAGSMAVLARALAASGAAVFDRAAPHAPAAAVEAALSQARELEADSLLAVGGGSAIGIAKAVARESGLAVIAIPTTYSGSEMTAIWGRSDGRAKQTARDPRVAPVLVLYDPALTTSLPPQVSAASGMNAMAHAVEAVYAPDAGEISSLFSMQAIRLLASSLPRVIADPQDRDARRDALLGAHFAGCALDLTSMGLEHKLAHVLSGSFGLPHAATHAVLLPHVVGFNAAAAPEAMARIAGALGADDAAGGLHALTQALGISDTLADLGLAEADVDVAAAEAVARPYANPRPAALEEVRALLADARSGTASAGRRS